MTEKSVIRIPVTPGEATLAPLFKKLIYTNATRAIRLTTPKTTDIMALLG
ncbi:MAG: hypothetical protein IKY04_05385 [Lachnospiraceae bacterium]|nr:hypothetical protein [Lachnospiraceae bacterium]MBR5944642.1 hypothetical protein [Lachnospiraceae bacterium]